MSDSPHRLYDRNFLIAFVSQTCFVGANTLMAHYARWIEFLGGDLREVGFIMGVCALLGLLLRPWMAQLINRFGARAMWGVGYAMFIGSSAANLALTDLGPWIYLVRSSLVLGTAIVFASGLTYITQTTPEDRRTEAIGIFGIGGFLGMIIGPFVGDLFLDQRTYESFANLFLLASAANVLPMLGLFLLRSSESGGKDTSLKLSEFIAVSRRFWPGTILLVDFAFGVCMAAPFIFVASFIDDAGLHLPGLSVIGIFFVCYAGLAIAIRLATRRLPDRIGAPRVLLTGAIFMSMGMACFALVDSSRPWLIIVPALMAGVGHGLMFHTMVSLTLRSFPSEVRGTGTAIALIMLDLGTIVGAPILGWIGESFGFAALFISIGTFCMLSCACYGIKHYESWKIENQYAK